MNKLLYNIMKYGFIIQYLIKYDSIFLNEYKIKLVNELIKTNINYSYILQLNDKELNKKIEEILKIFFEEEIIKEEEI